MNRALALTALSALLACGGSPTTVTSDGAGTATSDAATTPADAATTPGDAAFTPGTAITAPSETWTWVPFANAFCADGSTTGIGVNLTTKSSRVLLYLEGGGACWSALTCFTLMTAVNIAGGYGPSNFTVDATDTAYLATPGGFFDRTAAANPFKDYSYVYVPYCTGDIHAGNNTAVYGTMTAKHVGFANITAYLERLVPTFAGADRVYLAGSSAGGFGAIYNWWQTQKAFGSVRVDLIDDSGTFMPPDIAALGTGGAAQSASWNLAATLPPDCPKCQNGLDALYDYYALAFPNQQAALLSYTQDSVLPTFDGITETQFEQGLMEDIALDFTPHPNLHYFLVGSAGHVLFFSPSLATNTVTLQTWLTQMTTDDKSWMNQSP